MKDEEKSKKQLIEELKDLRKQASVLDITKRKKTEEQYQAFFTDNVSPVFWIEMDHPIPIDLPVDEQVDAIFREGYIKDVSQITAQAHGMESVDALIGVRLPTLYTPESILPEGDTYNLYKAFIDNGHLLRQYEASETSRSGEVKWYVNNVKGIVENGCLTRLWGSFVDVTDRKQAEEALHLQSSMVEQSSDSIIYTDLEYNIIYVNKSFESLFGYSLKELDGKKPDILNAEKQADTIQTDIYQSVSQDQVFEGESLNRKKDGTIFLCQYQVSPIKNKEGTIIGYMGSQRDITARKTAEKKLKESELKFRQVVEQSMVSIFITDVKRVVVDYNTAYKKLWGFSDKEIQEIHAGYNVRQDKELERMKLSPLIEKAYNGEQVVLPELSYDLNSALEDIKTDLPEKNSFLIRSRLYPLKNEAGEVIHVVVFEDDISEQKEHEIQLVKAKEKAEESEKRLSDIIFSMGDWVWEVDKNGRYIYSSEQGSEILGCSKEDIIGKTPFDFMPPEEAKRVSALFSEIIVKQMPIKDMKNLNINKNGKRITILTNGVPVFDELSNLIGYRGVDKDITERKQLEDKLRQKEKMQAIGQLSGGIAHDFNNILAGIVGYADMALDELLSNDLLTGYMKNILKASERAKKLVQQILTFSRQGQEEKHPINLGTVVEEVVELLKASIPSSVKLSVSIDNDACQVIADSTMVHEMLMNLSTNAVHAMDEKGELKITLREERINEFQQGIFGTIEPDFYSVLEVKDTGCGMSKSLIANAFDPFYTTKETGKGTGLGLSVAFGVMQSHSGNIQVESIVGEGTTFRLFFPKAEDKVTTKNEYQREARRGNEHILFVDDEDIIRDLGAELLSALGYKVTSTTDSMEALRLIKEDIQAYDLLITDQTMPGLTGFELSQEVLRIDPDFPIILCTGFSTKVNEVKAAEAGIKHFCYKPLTKREFAVKIREILDS